MHSLNILFVKNCHNELKFKTISFVLFYIELTLNIDFYNPVLYNIFMRTEIVINKYFDKCAAINFE